ncbi:response regulator transcription factor [Polaromonas sp.]|nr:response regulator transcription factor [Candidatus Saccharibacteria bacterium]
MNILLIDDDTRIASALKQALAGTHVIDHAPKGQVGLQQISKNPYDLILLDLNLPDIDGLEVCRQLRALGLDFPILVLSGNSGVLQKIALLDAGANDYLTKPFSLGELKARLRVLSRQISNAKPIPKTIQVGDITLDGLRHTVHRAGTEIVLRRKEFLLLECLMQNAGTVVTRQMLMHYAWQDDQDPWTNTIDVHIKYLRDKIDRQFAKPLIKTVHGIGYKIDIADHGGGPRKLDRRPPPGRVGQPNKGRKVH